MMRIGDGRPLPQYLKAEVNRELDRLELLLEQIKAVEADRNSLIAPAGDAVPVPVAMLMGLRGIGAEFANMLYSEGLFRHFGNRRHVAAYSGLAPTPWQSGSIDREQGVSKAGNPRLRSTMIELAWLWVRHQPDSALSQWFRERAKVDTRRNVTIVALARKQLVAPCRYVTAGVAIGGAIIKTA